MVLVNFARSLATGRVTSILKLKRLKQRELVGQIDRPIHAKKYQFHDIRYFFRYVSPFRGRFLRKSRQKYC